jgi:hypothetical protein
VPELADIIRLHGDAYLERFGKDMLPSHRRALIDIRDCRTAAMGGQVYLCDHCGQEHYVYHSCRNRACPKCHGRQTHLWLEKRREELLPVPHFHVIFTVPAQLNEMLRSHQKLYGLLMKAAAESVIQLAKDPKYVGGLIGVMAVLHTWGRDLSYHPHVHCLIPGGGLDRKGIWHPSRPNFLVPVRALSRIFRAKFLDSLAKALPEAVIPDAARKQNWVVHCKPAISPEKVLDYLGRYVHRIVITNGRILHVDERIVTFSYKKVDDPQQRTMTLPAHEFLRRFLQHVPHKGDHRVRYYGLWATSNRHKLQQLRQRLTSPQPPDNVAPPAEVPSAPPEPQQRAMPCPLCRKGTLVFRRRIPRQQPRSPP